MEGSNVALIVSLMNFAQFGTFWTNLVPFRQHLVPFRQDLVTIWLRFGYYLVPAEQITKKKCPELRILYGNLLVNSNPAFLAYLGLPISHIRQNPKNARFLLFFTYFH